MRRTQALEKLKANNSIHKIDLIDITPSLARETGFSSLAELLKTAKHGLGENVYLVSFHYVQA